MEDNNEKIIESLCGITELAVETLDLDNSEDVEIILGLLECCPSAYLRNCLHQSMKNYWSKQVLILCWKFHKKTLTFNISGLTRVNEAYYTLKESRESFPWTVGRKNIPTLRSIFEKYRFKTKN